MKFFRLGLDTNGTSALEFALLVPVFLAVLFGIMGSGAVMWVQFGLQHGVEMAARCASINTTICGTTADIENYAVQQTYGVAPPASIFTVSAPACGVQVSAAYSYQFLAAGLGLPPITLAAKACFPK